MKAARPKIVRRVLSGLLFLTATVLSTIWWNGYVIDVFGRTANARIRLHALPEDAMEGSGPVVGTVEPGARCCLLQVKVKGLAAFHVRCSDGLGGWTDEAQAFDPPLRAGLFGK